MCVVYLCEVCPRFRFHVQGINGIPPIPNGYNPATWMLEVTTPTVEERIGEDFAEIYKNSEQFR
jgi:hypothetical protein